jgi:hypothetical protein
LLRSSNSDLIIIVVNDKKKANELTSSNAGQDGCNANGAHVNKTDQYNKYIEHQEDVKVTAMVPYESNDKSALTTLRKTCFCQ